MIRRSLLRSIGALALIGLAGVPRAIAAGDPAAFIQELGTQAIQVLGPNVPFPQRVAVFRSLLQQDFDLSGIGKFVLGPYARQATPDQQQQFLGLYHEYVAANYARKLGQYGGAPFRVTGVRPNGTETIVTSQIPRPAGDPINIDWHIANVGGRDQIVDVYVNGVSMKASERQEFASIIANNGGRFDALLAVMRQQVASR